jgi:hypothetical protein
MFAIGEYLKHPKTGKTLIIQAVEKDVVLCKVHARRRKTKAGAPRHGRAKRATGRVKR